jgi:hypothetical protein
MLTQGRVKELFNYDPETGELIRRVSVGKTKASDVAGCPNGQGYLQTMVDGNRYFNHRLVWLHVYGYFPEHGIDHINRNRSDNRLENLREVSQSCNMRNARQPSTNTSGVQGVCWNKRGQKWKARIGTGKKVLSLGYHSSFLEAACHRLAAEQCLNWGSCDSASPASKYVRENLCK